MSDETTAGQSTPTPNPTPQPTVSEPAPKPASDPVGEQVIKMTLAQWQAHQEERREYAEFKTQQAAILEKKEQDRLKAIGEKEGVEKALNAARDAAKNKEAEWAGKYNTLHQMIGNEKIDALIASSIAGKTFIGQTDEVRALAAADFKTIARTEGRLAAVQATDGGWTIRDPATGRDGADVLAELIARKSYLFAATTQGGTPNGGNALNNGGPGAPKPGSVDEVAARFTAQQAKSKSFGLTRVG